MIIRSTEHFFHDTICLFNGSQLAKMKKSIPGMSLRKIYRDEAVGLKSCKNT